MSKVQSPKSILELILKKNVDQAEVYLATNKTLKIDVLDQKVEAIEEIRDQGLGIRVIKNNKLGFAYASDLDETVIRDVIDQAIANAANSGSDENNVFPSLIGLQDPLPLCLFDTLIRGTPIQEKIKLALKIESSARAADKRVTKTEKVTYSDSEMEIRIANSHGVDLACKSNQCGAMAEMIAEQNGEMESGPSLSFVKSYAELKAEIIGREAAEQACSLLGARSIISQKIPLVFDQFTGADLLEVLANLLSSEAVQKGRSLFAGKLGEAVAATGVTIIDNGRLANGLASAPFDDEGTPTQETTLIDSGKLSSYLFNAYTAKKGKTRSTGNASRGSFKSPPAISPTNLYFKPGVQSPTSIVKEISNGLFITRLMGMHTANPISGDFSLGAAGIMIENGQKTYPVRGITIAGNLVDLLRSIEVVGSDLRFITNIGSPTLLINNLTVSGS